MRGAVEGGSSALSRSGGVSNRNASAPTGKADAMQYESMTSVNVRDLLGHSRAQSLACTHSLRVMHFAKARWVGMRKQPGTRAGYRQGTHAR